MGRGNFIATTSNVFARANYLTANPFRDYRFIHDYFFLAGASFRDQIAVCPEVHLQYRVHGSNTITTKPEPLIREMLLMHLDLYRHYAEELKADPVKRARFYEYGQAMWENMSSLHAGLLQVLLAQLAKRAPQEEIAALVAGLQGPEFDVAPNRTLAGAFDGKEPLSAAVLSRRLDDLREKTHGLQQERTAFAELARLRGLLTRSRWVALGNLLGAAGALTKNEGSSAPEKLAKLQAALSASGWLKLGCSLGSKSAAESLRQTRTSG
jgi:hypothetical protein